MSMDRSQDGTQPIEVEDATQSLPAAEPQDVPSAPPVAQSPAPEPGAPDRNVPGPGPGTTQAAPERTGYAAPVTSAASPSPVAATTPERPKGPNAGAILLGLLALAVAVLAILRQTTDLSINWSAVGPGAVIAAGVLLLAVGVVGMARRERRGL